MFSQLFQFSVRIDSDSVYFLRRVAKLLRNRTQLFPDNPIGELYPETLEIFLYVVLNSKVTECSKR